MRYENDDKVWTALRRFTNGATVKEVAASVEKPPANVGSRLSKLYYYGFLERIPTGEGRQYRYRVKPQTAA